MQAFQPWKDMVGVLSGKWGQQTSKDRELLEMNELGLDEHPAHPPVYAPKTRRWGRIRFNGQMQRSRPL